jgi:hypothetical protein
MMPSAYVALHHMSADWCGRLLIYHFTSAIICSLNWIYRPAGHAQYSGAL